MVIRKIANSRRVRRIAESRRLRHELKSFQVQFKKHLTTFMTGAFAFVAALLWRDAISNSLESVKSSLPNVGLWADYLVALVITIVAVVAIVVISKLLKVEE